MFIPFCFNTNCIDELENTIEHKCFHKCILQILILTPETTLVALSFAIKEQFNVTATNLFHMFFHCVLRIFI